MTVLHASVLAAVGLVLLQCDQASAGPFFMPRQAGIVPPNVTVSIDPAYPTDVGFPGTTRVGQAPFLAERDRINTTQPKTGASIELRYTALTDANSTSPSSNGSATGAADATPSATPIAQLWGNTAPYFPSPLFADAQQYRQLDQQCTLEQVHILHRHGSRYPTSSSTEGAPFFGQVVANASRDGNLTVTGPLAFLSNWTYQLGAELLVPNGAQELFDSGVKHYYDYGALYNASTQQAKPVIRTTSQQRMLDSARFWTTGFFGLDAPSLIDLQVILEGDGFNNTLASYDTCNNSNTLTVGDTYLTPVWEAVYLNKTVPRLQQYIPSGINLTTEMVYGMQSLCAYETVGLGYSPFCQLFTEEEWQGFEYFLDLQFQGDYGSMSPSGRAQGIGYVQELLARLSNTTIPPANVSTQNTTLTVPGKQPFYVDFSHDDIILSVLTALNYTQVVGDYLPAEQMDANRTFYLSHITPFAARLVLEIADCGGGQKVIRTLLNDALVPMNEAQGCSPVANGTCPLDDFVRFQSQNAEPAANFVKACFGKNGTDFIITGPTVRNGTVA